MAALCAWAAMVAGCQSQNLLQEVALESLLQSPRSYVSDAIETTGHAQLAGGRLYLFASRAYAEAEDLRFAVLLADTADGPDMSLVVDCHDQYVTVIGRFQRLPGGRMGLGGIERVAVWGSDGQRGGLCYRAGVGASF